MGTVIVVVVTVFVLLVAVLVARAIILDYRDGTRNVTEKIGRSRPRKERRRRVRGSTGVENIASRESTPPVSGGGLRKKNAGEAQAVGVSNLERILESGREGDKNHPGSA